MAEIWNITCDENTFPKEQIKNLSFEDFLNSEIFHTYYDLWKEDISFDADTQFLQSYWLAPPSIVIDRLQKILLSLWYLSLKDLVGADRPVDEDDVYDASQREVCYAGVFGWKTQTAVESFQIDMKEQILWDILVDGIVGRETKTLLYKAIYKKMVGIDMVSLWSIPNFDTTHNNRVLSEGNLENNSLFMADFDLNIHSDSGVQDENTNGTNIDEIVAQMIASKTIDSGDAQWLMELDNAFRDDIEGKLSNTKEALKALMLDVLAKGYEVKGTAQIENFQRVLNIAGLWEDFVVKDIYEANREELRTVTTKRNRRSNNTTVESIIEPEDKWYTFALKNGQLKIYEHQDWDVNGNDIIGYVIPGDSTMIPVNNITASEDDDERDNHSFNSKKDYIGTLWEALHKDAVNAKIAWLKQENESLRETDRQLEEKIQTLTNRIGAIEIQVSAFQSRISDLESQAGDMKKDIDNLEAQVQYLLSEQNSLLTRIAELETGAKSTTQTLEELEEKVQEIQLKCETVEQELKDLQEKYELDIPAIDSIKQEKAEEFNTGIVALEQDIKAGNGTKAEFQARLDALQKLVPIIGRGQMSLDLLQKMIDDIKESEDTLEEEIGDDVENRESFSLNNPIQFLDWNREVLSAVDMNSKADIIRLLERFTEARFPQQLEDSTVYVFAVQCAISYLGINNMWNIDGLFGDKSKSALKKVQENILGFTGSAIDGKPGPVTVNALLGKISQGTDTQTIPVPTPRPE